MPIFNMKTYKYETFEALKINNNDDDENIETHVACIYLLIMKYLNIYLYRTRGIYTENNNI